MRYLIALLLFLASLGLQAQSLDAFDSLLLELEMRSFFKENIKSTREGLGIRRFSKSSSNTMLFEIAPLRPANAEALSIVKFQVFEKHLFLEFDFIKDQKREHFKRAFAPAKVLDSESMNIIEYREFSVSIAHKVIAEVFKELFQKKITVSNKYFKASCVGSAN